MKIQSLLLSSLLASCGAESLTSPGPLPSALSIVQALPSVALESAPPLVPILPELEPAPEPEPEPPDPPTEPEPDPEPAPEPECKAARVESVMGCFSGVSAWAEITVAGQGDYQVFLMDRYIFDRDIIAEGTVTVGCSGRETIQLSGDTARQVMEEDPNQLAFVVTVFVGGEQLVYHELAECQ